MPPLVLLLSLELLLFASLWKPRFCPLAALLLSDLQSLFSLKNVILNEFNRREMFYVLALRGSHIDFHFTSVVPGEKSEETEHVPLCFLLILRTLPDFFRLFSMQPHVLWSTHVASLRAYSLQVSSSFTVSLMIDSPSLPHYLHPLYLLEFLMFDCVSICAGAACQIRLSSQFHVLSVKHPVLYVV